MTKTEKNTLVPKLRFQGFGNSSNCKLGDITTFSSGGTPSKDVPSYWLPEIPWISATAMRGNLYSDSPTWISNEGLKNGSKLMEEGGILLLVRGSMLWNCVPIGIAQRPLAFNQDVKGILTNHSANNYFLLQWFKAKEHRLLNMVVGTGIGAGKLDTSDLKSFNVVLPTLPEQKKIAAFLTAVDDRIEQLKRKKTLLASFKKGVMQRLFSNDECGMLNDEFQHNETTQHSSLCIYHSLRFRNEKGEPYPDWQEKKLGEIASFSKGKGISKAEIDEEGSQACIRYGELYTLYNETISVVHSFTNLPPKDLVFSKKNDVIIPASGETHIDIATASCVTKANIALGGDLNIIRSSANGVFLSYYLNNAVKHKIAGLAQGSSVIHLYASQLKDLKITIPSLAEQTKIANYLSNLDTKIEQITQQITQTQTFKKGLLQQMFV